MPGLDKELMMKELKDNLEGSDYIFFTSFEKVTVSQISELRQILEKLAKKSFVAKNTLISKVLEERGIKSAGDLIKGSMFLTATDKDPQEISKALVKFAKDNEGFKINGIFSEGNIFKKDYVSHLSKLPSKKEILGMVVCGIKSPITNFVLNLNAIIRSFAVVLNEVSKKKGA